MLAGVRDELETKNYRLVVMERGCACNRLLIMQCLLRYTLHAERLLSLKTSETH